MCSVIDTKITLVNLHDSPTLVLLHFHLMFNEINLVLKLCGVSEMDLIFTPVSLGLLVH